MKERFLLMGGLFVAVLVACQPEQELKLNQSQQTEVKRRVQERMLAEGPRIDSLCELHFEESVQAAVDSLLPLQLREVARQRQSKIQNKAANQ